VAVSTRQPDRSFGTSSCHVCCTPHAMPCHAPYLACRVACCIARRGQSLCCRQSILDLELLFNSCKKENELIFEVIMRLKSLWK
jgi:hypothetical protein